MRTRALLPLCAALLFAFATAAYAQEKPPFQPSGPSRGPSVKDRPLERVSERVWIIQAPEAFPTPGNQGLMANLTFVDTEKGLVVVNTGSSEQIGEMAIGQIRAGLKKPVVAIVNTHHHGDHWLGNGAFAAAYPGVPIYAHPGAMAAIRGAPGEQWRANMEKVTGGATAGTRVVPPSESVENGSVLRFGDTTLRMHHYGKAHTPHDIVVEVVEDGVTVVGDVAMDRRIANMEDGSYLGTLATYDALEANTKTRTWLPAHGRPGPDVLRWNRELFEGIYRVCEQAVKDGKSIEEAKELVLKDPRVAARAADTAGFKENIGKYVSLAFLEAEAAGF